MYCERSPLAPMLLQQRPDPPGKTHAFLPHGEQATTSCLAASKKDCASRLYSGGLICSIIPHELGAVWRGVQRRPLVIVQGKQRKGPGCAVHHIPASRVMCSW